jgi:hypothetical protein
MFVLCATSPTMTNLLAKHPDDKITQQHPLNELHNNLLFTDHLLMPSTYYLHPSQESSPAINIMQQVTNHSWVQHEVYYLLELAHPPLLPLPSILFLLFYHPGPLYQTRRADTYIQHYAPHCHCRPLQRSLPQNLRRVLTGRANTWDK